MKLLLSLAALCLILPRQDTQAGCDLAKVESAHWCDSCSDVRLKADLVSNKTYYVCEDCGTIEEKAGKCDECDTARAKKTSGENACGTCYDQTVVCQVCVKEFYECPDCAHQSGKAGKCEDCQTALQKAVSRAMVSYQCKECGADSSTAGKCTDDDCPSKGKPLVKTCANSGDFPHVAGK